MEYWTSGNVAIRPMCFSRPGDGTIGHKHNFDHVTYVVRGAIRVERLDDAGRTEAEEIKRADDPNGHNWLLIKAHTEHRITALDPDTVAHCIYAHREPQGDVVQEWNGWGPAYV